MSVDGDKHFLSNITWGDGVNDTALLAALKASTNKLLQSKFSDITPEDEATGLAAQKVAEVLSKNSEEFAQAFGKGHKDRDRGRAGGKAGGICAQRGNDDRLVHSDTVRCGTDAFNAYSDNFCDIKTAEMTAQTEGKSNGVMSIVR